MIDRSKRGIRSVHMKVRLAVAAAVLVGGGAAAAAVLAANHSGATATTAESAGFTTRAHHPVSEQVTLSDAVASRGGSPSRTLALLAELTRLRSFVQLDLHHTTIAAQRGVVLLATRKFLVVRSANGSLHLWWWNRATEFKDADATMTGMTALTGSRMAAAAAMNGDMMPASTVMAGSARAVSQLTTPMAEPSSLTINTGGQVVTITVARSTATVEQPLTMMTARTTRTRQSAWWATHRLMRGDLVFVVGTRAHGRLMADLVLFAPRTTTRMPRARQTPAMRATAAPRPNATIGGQPVVIGTHS